MAATAAEARFRIDAPDPTPQATRVVALDGGAAAMVRRAAERHWRSAHFLTYEAGALIPRADGQPPDLVLHAADGSEVRLSAELAEADVSVMVATVDDGAQAASVIGEACWRRGIMTAGLVLGEGRDVAAAVSALRPHARVLLVSTDEDDVPEILAALRA
ncbi:MAG TPA: hypothetical protein VK891_04240 [Euzebyales bacterium]|nr:hypothetical protein [Euzebyales bacterium]